MGCMQSCLSGRRGKADDEIDGQAAATRPHRGAVLSSSTLADDEKALDARQPTSSLPGALSARRNPAIGAKFDEHGGPKSSIQWAGSPTSTQASDLTIVASEREAELGRKAKDEDVDDVEARRRVQKAEAARRKAEEEEQEQRDFLQWM